MIRRLTSSLGVGLSQMSLQPCWALRQSLREGYKAADLRSDLMAGIVVGIVALPLSMALAIASGVPPQYGLYTAIVAGALVALLGGSRVQVSGPTAAFVVVLAPVSAQYGLQGLAIATVMAGLILMLMGVLRMGRLIEFIPYPVTTGFTAGIAVVIATIQLKDFMGLTIHVDGAEESYLQRVQAIVSAAIHHDWAHHWADLFIGLVTLAILIGWSRFTKKVPAALVALSFAAALAFVLHEVQPKFEVATIRSRYATESMPAGIPQLPPTPVLPWHLPGPVAQPGSDAQDAGAPSLSFEHVQALVPTAFAIAMLGAIESLLSAVVSDGMCGSKHNPDAELLALGTGNLVAPFFGGFAATGAIARTAAGVRSGSRSPLAAVFHAAFVLAAMLVLAPLLGYLPMASMAALLLIVAWNMSEARHFIHAVRVSPRSDVAVLLTCFVLTVLLDMTVAVSAGVMLAALLFMQRMASLAGARLIGEHHPDLDQPLPPGLLIYEIAGPLFFGAAQRAMSALGRLDKRVRVVLLDMRDVPVIDATGLVNLESAVDRLYRAGITVVLAGVQDQPARVLNKAQWHRGEGRIRSFPSFEQGLTTARTLVHLIDDGSAKSHANPAVPV